MGGGGGPNGAKKWERIILIAPYILYGFWFRARE